MAGMEEVEVAHSERATLRVGDVFLKIDADQIRTDVEVEAMAMAPVPTPEILWRKPPVLALAALGGTALGHSGGPGTWLVKTRPRPPVLRSSRVWSARSTPSSDCLSTSARGSCRQRRGVCRRR
jgi:hypothetical protein